MDKISSMLVAVLVSLTTFVSSLFTPVAQLDNIQLIDETVTQELSIVSYNVYVSGFGKKSPENRTKAVVDTILAQKPDSFGLQEVDEGWLERLSVAMTDYSFVARGRDADGGGESSPVFYLKDKYTLLDSGVFWLSPTPDKPSRGWDAMMKRICTYAVLQDKQTGFTYAHFNAHLDHLGAISRCEAIAVITEKMSAFEMPLVLTGDFNGKEGTVMYDRVLEAGLLDTKYLAQESDSGATYHGYTYEDKFNKKPIDYIFVNNCVDEVASYKIIRDKADGNYPSDHYAVASKLIMTYGKESENMVRIMSFNVLCYGNEEHFWTTRQEAVALAVKTVAPDSFGVQEAHKEWMDVLAALLPDYAYVGVGRDDGVDDGEFSAVFYLKNKYKAEESETFWISETPDVPSRSWETACTRICTWAKLVNIETGESYVHMNTHLDHVSELARVNGVKMIKEKAASFGEIPVVCTGDFNVVQDTDCYVDMVSGNMGDARKLAESTTDKFTFHAFKPDKVHSIIDFVFIDRNTVKAIKFDVLDTQLCGNYYSDHYAVYADLEFIK